MNKRKRTLFRRVYSAYTLNKFDGSFFFPLSHSLALCTHLSSFEWCWWWWWGNFNCLQKNLANAIEIKSHWMTFFLNSSCYVCAHTTVIIIRCQKAKNILFSFYFISRLICIANFFLFIIKYSFLTREREAYRIS